MPAFPLFTPAGCASLFAGDPAGTGDGTEGPDAPVTPAPEPPGFPEIPELPGEDDTDDEQAPDRGGFARAGAGNAPG